MFRLKRYVDLHDLKELEKECQRKILTHTIPIKQKLENAGYVVDYKYIDVKKRGFHKRKVHICELGIYPSDITKSKAKKQFKLKIFRLFLCEKERVNEKSFSVILRNDFYYRFFITLILRLLVVGDINKKAEDNIFDFFFRVFHPGRAGELAFVFRGKDFEWVRVVLFFVVSLIVGILASLKEASFLSSLGYGYY